MNTYSQVSQDLWVLEMLKNKKNGFFLDIGAYDGIKFSNSYILEKQYGWKGLLVEAHIDNFKKMCEIRDNTLVNCAMTDFNGKVFFDYNGNTGSKISNHGFEVESITFDELFKRYNVPNIIDYMSLDIEGNEFISLQKFPFNTHICSLITVEHNLYIDGEENKNKIKNLLINNGYILVKENVTCENLPFEDWYKHNTLI